MHGNAPILMQIFPLNYILRNVAFIIIIIIISPLFTIFILKGPFYTAFQKAHKIRDTQMLSSRMENLACKVQFRKKKIAPGKANGDKV